MSSRDKLRKWGGLDESQPVIGYPWPDPTNRRIKQLEAKLAAKDAETERLREGWMAAECGYNPGVQYCDRHLDDEYTEAEICPHTRQGTDYCRDVIDTVNDVPHE